MASLQYYATLDDQRLFLVDLLAEMPDVRVFESYSDFDAELREFDSAESMLRELPQPHGILYLQVLLVPTIPMRITRIDLNPSTGHTFRYHVEGVGFAQLYLGCEDERGIRVSSFGHFEPSTAKARGANDRSLLPTDADWVLRAKRSRRLRYKLRKLATGKIGGWLLLPAADRMSRGGFPLYRQFSDTTEVRQL